MNKKIIYLAGGCFWGMEHLIKSLNGVISTTCGYANGSNEFDANYKTVCSGKTGFQETVEVIYDSDVICLENILLAYFYVVHVDQKNQQGNDIGTQYQSGVYYIDEESKNIVDKVFAIEKQVDKPFYVDKGLLNNFFSAEEYHQDYLDKNKNGYCHISFNDINKVSKIKINKEDYNKPSKLLINEMLGD